MAVEKEAVEIRKETIDRIVNFYPGTNEEVLSAEGINLGKVNGYDIVYGRFPYQRRTQQGDGESLTPEWTKQPVVALVNVQQVKTLPYSIDVRSLGGSLAEAVAEKLRFWNSSTWPEDY
ncbi:MAG: hypothetical protein NUV73_01085 [Candidatus Daviesbacteria bacterium]|nr:hypothetical protein [Candidatus Daviesbacteria bacterium]